MPIGWMADLNWSAWRQPFVWNIPLRRKTMPEPKDNPLFQTRRTRHFRGQALGAFDEGLIANVEEYGYGIVHIPKSNWGQGWSFTVGVYDTCGSPEIITIGLLSETAGVLLNEAAKAARRGVDLTKGRHREMIGEVECEFRPVDPKWIKPLMGYACWYYGTPVFPVLQAVYPDRKNRFPEEEGFETYFRQPLLQPHLQTAAFERDFLAATDPVSSLFDWKFPDPPNTNAYLSRAVHAGAEEVTYVSHDADDGAWQFLGDSMSGGQPPALSCLHHPFDKDPSLKELADLPVGWYATRAKRGAPWERHQQEPEDPEV